MKYILAIGGILFALGIGSFITYFVTQQVVDQLVAIPVINESTEAVTAFNQMKTTQARTDYLLFAVFIGLTLFMIITGYISGTNPIFAAVYFIILVIAVVISPILSNIWEDVSTASVFGTTVSNFPISNHILLNLPIYITVVGIIAFVAMFVRSQQSSVSI